MPLTDAALTTVAAAQSAIGGSPSSSVVEPLIEAASSAMARIANRDFYYEAGIVERLKGEGTFRLILKRPPITSITSIILYDVAGNAVTTYASTDYEIEDADEGFVWKDGGWLSTGQYVTGISGMLLPGTERKALRVTYTGGWVTPQQEADDGSLTRDLPYDLEEACLAAVVHLYRNKSRDRAVAGESTDNKSITYYQSPRAILPPESVAVARAYWRP